MSKNMLFLWHGVSGSSDKGKHIIYIFFTLKMTDDSPIFCNVSQWKKNYVISYDLLMNEAWNVYSWPVLLATGRFREVVRIHEWCHPKLGVKQSSCMTFPYIIMYLQAPVFSSFDLSRDECLMNVWSNPFFPFHSCIVMLSQVGRFGVKQY